ncbi:phosphoglucosamine mutase [Acetivibrio sp. MSJd-27]|uniref:phosphoglucosamine mutase n=1 Tax=Acetivibrio sp. MSJd-27 TaxID=2841523 RepID=UPI001C0F9761|nr:phosphoglucosamine mutase [Acetivibrio sp. MSJd-27]MBU5449753.1 phosphoglucosamine mutase [Acetivibrio sp. MSJd-27]
MGKLFGTDGVRGVANTELTADLAYKVGKAGSYVLAKETHHRPKILVGIDTRISCDMLQNALASGILSAGGDVYILGVIPTPAVAYLVRKHKADAGVMISASHNPMEYNGIKFFNGSGFKLNDEMEDEIEEIIFHGMESLPTPTGGDLGRIYDLTSAAQEYRDFIKSKNQEDLSGLKLLLDCANGATSNYAGSIFSDLGAEVTVIHNQPDGTNINQNCGSTHMESLKEKLLSGSYDLGIAYDGDGDRVLTMTADGELVDGDKIIAIIGKYLKEQGKLSNNTIVGTIMSNLGLKLMAEENEMDIILSNVGDRYVLEDMLKGNFSIGGEQSGHIILLDYNTTGDGIMSSLVLLNVMKHSKKTLKDLSEIMTTMPQVLENVKVPNDKKAAVMADKEIAKEISRIEELLNGKGRVLLRPSGTEPLIRIMLEGPDVSVIQDEADILAKLIQTKLL